MINTLTIIPGAWVEILECSICGNRFSSGMMYSWKACASGLPHEKMDFKQQQKWKPKVDDAAKGGGA